MSKGSTQRPFDKDKFDTNYDAIFRKAQPQPQPNTESIEGVRLTSVKTLAEWMSDNDVLKKDSGGR